MPAAILSALEAVSGLRLDLKWPNDLFWQGRKLCGVLIDARGNPADRYLIGVGINVNRGRFPPELSDLATSLALATGEEFDREELVLAIACSIDAALTSLTNGDIAELETLFADRLGCLGKLVHLRGEGIDAKGRLSAITFAKVSLDDGHSYALAHITGMTRN